VIIGVDNQDLSAQNGQAARFVQHYFNTAAARTRLPGAHHRLYRTWFEVQPLPLRAKESEAKARSLR